MESISQPPMISMKFIFSQNTEMRSKDLIIIISATQTNCDTLSLLAMDERTSFGRLGTLAP